MANAKQIARFEARRAVGRPGDCWLWDGGRRPGYGFFYLPEDRIRRAHQAAYAIYFGPIPMGMCVLHTCDMPNCVNPGHLFLGTKGENNTDRAKKGRSNPLRGEASKASKLTADLVVSIFLDAREQSEIAISNGVSQSQVSRIKSAKTWRHITSSLASSAHQPPKAGPD